MNALEGETGTPDTGGEERKAGGRRLLSQGMRILRSGRDTRKGAPPGPSERPDIGPEGELRRQQVAANRAGEDEDPQQDALSNPDGGAMRPGVGADAGSRKNSGGTRLQQSIERMEEAKKKMDSSAVSEQGAAAAERASRGRKGIGGKTENALAKLNVLRKRRQARKAAKEHKKAKKEVMKIFVGIMWIRACWGWLMPSFGHSIYLINLSFFIGFMQKYIGFYLPITIPEVGEEWLFNFTPNSAVSVSTGPSKKVGQAAPKSGKSKIMIIKVFELAFMLLMTLVVFAGDVLILATIVLLIYSAQETGVAGFFASFFN